MPASIVGLAIGGGGGVGIARHELWL